MLLATSHGKLRESSWLFAVINGPRVWYWSPERTVPQAHTRSEVAVGADTSYPPSSYPGLASPHLSSQSPAVHLHVVCEANAHIGFREKNICQKGCTLLLLRRNRDVELLLRAIPTLDSESTHSSTARRHSASTANKPK